MVIITRWMGGNGAAELAGEGISPAIIDGTNSQQSSPQWGGSGAGRGLVFERCRGRPNAQTRGPHGPCK